MAVGSKKPLHTWIYKVFVLFALTSAFTPQIGAITRNSNETKCICGATIDYMRFPSWRAIACLAALVFLSFPAPAQQTLTVDRLIEAIKSSVKEKNPDKDVAARLEQR